MRRLLAILMLCAAAQAAGHRRATRLTMSATAFCLHGTTAAGTRSHVGTAAADPAYLPMGTRIRVSNAGRYSGTYLITDTGAAMHGRRIDLRLPTPGAARQFGRRMVTVQVLHWGSGDVSRSADRKAARSAPGL